MKTEYVLKLLISTVFTSDNQCLLTCMNVELKSWFLILHRIRVLVIKPGPIKLVCSQYLLLLYSQGELIKRSKISGRRISGGYLMSRDSVSENINKKNKINKVKSKN